MAAQHHQKERKFQVEFPKKLPIDQKNTGAGDGSAIPENEETEGATGALEAPKAPPVMKKQEK